MKKHAVYPAADERGSVIMVTLIIMLLITVIGFSAINTSDVDLQIAQNDRLHRQQFYLAESAIVEGFQRLELSVNPEAEGIDLNNNKETANLDDGSNTLTYAIDDQGIASGYSLSIGSGTVKNMHNLIIAGVYDQPTGAKSGHVEIEIGVKKKI